MRAASLHSNEWLSLSNHGNVVVLERWGAIEVSRFRAAASVEQYAQWQIYRREARSMVLDTLSRRTGRMVQFVDVLAMHLGLSHRALLPLARLAITCRTPTANQKPLFPLPLARHTITCRTPVVLNILYTLELV